MHYFRLWISFAKNCLSRELEFRQNFLVRISGNILWFITTILFFRVIYLHTPTIGGWELWQSMLLVSTNQIINYRLFPNLSG
ncbi:hypothetical protein LR066_00545 [candidate division WOR-3 bacterium]|nr:hypothetical protein [candidate division WOR-3 bacterium]